MMTIGMILSKKLLSYECLSICRLYSCHYCIQQSHLLFKQVKRRMLHLNHQQPPLNGRDFDNTTIPKSALISYRPYEDDPVPRLSPSSFLTLFLHMRIVTPHSILRCSTPTNRIVVPVSSLLFNERLLQQIISPPKLLIFSPLAFYFPTISVI